MEGGKDPHPHTSGKKKGTPDISSKATQNPYLCRYHLFAYPLFNQRRHHRHYLHRPDPPKTMVWNHGLHSEGVRVRFRVRFQTVKVPIFGGFPVENPTKKANRLKALLRAISLSEYGSEGSRVRLRGLSEYGSVAYLVSADCKRGRRKGATSKNVKNRQNLKVSKSFSTIFVHGKKHQKSSKSMIDTFRQFSRGTISPAPFWGALSDS